MPVAVHVTRDADDEWTPWKQLTQTDILLMKKIRLYSSAQDIRATPREMLFFILSPF